MISTATRLDREHIAEYHLTIEARDNVAMPETEQRRTSGYMKIILRDVNDNVPRFEQTRYMAAVSEGTKVKSHFSESINVYCVCETSHYHLSL